MASQVLTKENTINEVQVCINDCIHEVRDHHNFRIIRDGTECTQIYPSDEQLNLQENIPVSCKIKNHC